jgi:hypothetical protein
MSLSDPRLQCGTAQLVTKAKLLKVNRKLDVSGQKTFSLNQANSIPNKARQVDQERQRFPTRDSKDRACLVPWVAAVSPWPAGQ